ncbi:hypothetical protein SAMN05216387_101110 [Nitrosovibrio tenuis]|uniref:Uncharacterized protein n=1 Tax=Nitrosovibrio tenuis TaxID=1233 RepID=A0A1H7FX89_9PROT|nr:hypothetical protein SAMN05216387_101110 [Nitrosovibrio tenuis]
MIIPGCAFSHAVVLEGAGGDIDKIPFIPSARKLGIR